MAPAPKPNLKPTEEERQAAALEKLNKDIELAKNRAIQVKNQVTALEKQRDRVRGEIEAETERARKAQNEILAADLRKHQAQLDELNGLIKQAKAKLLKAEDDLAHLDGRGPALEREIEAKTAAVGKLTEKELAIKETIAAAHREATEINGNLDGLRGQLSPLREQIAELELKLSETQAAYDEKIVTLQGKVDELTTTKERLEFDIASLTRRKNEMATDMAAERAEMDRVREDLAIERRKNEALAKNVRIREIKAAQAEGRIAENTNLLNL